MKNALPRRQFLTDVARGTLMATMGPVLATELGLISKGFAAEDEPKLSFGEIDSLVAFMQETPLAKLQPALLEHLRQGVPLERLVAAGALANARSFGGEDYTGFHTMMALSPALKMSRGLPENQRALPVFKVLYRNTNRIHEFGGRKAEVLHPVEPSTSKADAQTLLAAVKRKDAAEAERLFAELARRDAQEALDTLLVTVHEGTDVHRTVLPYRAWDLLDVVGRQHAHTLLRQSLRFCLQAERYRSAEWEEHGKVLVRLLDQHKLLGKEPGSRVADDAFVESLCESIFRGTGESAATAVAQALADGFDPASIGEALSLAANQLVLRDHGRTPEMEIAGKPIGSVHGDSIGVHASDSANAWRNLARVSRGRNVYACLILGAWQAAEDRVNRGGDFLSWEPVPPKWQVDGVKSTEPAKLLAELDEAVRGNLQSRASAIVEKIGQLGQDPKPVFQTLLRYAVSEDGALHAEKYFQTTWEEFHATRPAFRWRHLKGLARVTASEFGRPAAGQEEARALLGV